MGNYVGEGKTYEEVLADVKQYLEQPPMIMLPGGSWCPLCKAELCRIGKHQNLQNLLLVISAMARHIETLNKEND